MGVVVCTNVYWCGCGCVYMGVGVHRWMWVWLCLGREFLNRSFEQVDFNACICLNAGLRMPCLHVQYGAGICASLSLCLCMRVCVL